jgi:hypothetical protein
MRRFKFTGDEPVDVPRLGLVDVQPGDVVEVADKDAADGLEGQDIWEPVKASTKKES